MNIRKTNDEEEKRKAVCREVLAQDRQKLLMRWPFIGGIMMRMELVPVRDDRLDTASTNGDSVFVDIDFYAKLTAEQRLFVLAHEVWHCVLLHFARKGGRDHEMFNYAADLEIHFTLRQENMAEPWVLPHDPGWESLSAEEIYEQLKKKSQECPFGDAGKANENIGDNSTSFDKHVYSGDNAEEIPDEGGDFVTDSDYAPIISADAVERARSRSIAAAQQVERVQGSLPAHIDTLIKRLKKPQLRWQELLKQFLTSCYGGNRRWLPPSRRHVWHNLYLPSMRTEALKAAVAIDTSGSTAEDLEQFFAELTGLLNSFGNYELTILQCDAEIQQVEHYSDVKLQPPKSRWKAFGGGGTSFLPVFKYIDKHPDERPNVLLYFTDGFGSAPEHAPNYPVMWVLTEGGVKPCKWGHSVKFKRKDSYGNG